VSLPVRAKQQALHLVVDSTGLKVYGEGRVPLGRESAPARLE